MVTLAISSFSDNKQYFYTVDEVYSRGSEVIDVPLKVKGNLIQGTIEKVGKQVKFKIKNNNQVMEIVYVGEHALPDTFHNATEAEVVATGKYIGKGEFEAEHIQAKCASKYENDYTKEY
jgi:cytochrome c-type biogenesis protein CcmE